MKITKIAIIVSLITSNALYCKEKFDKEKHVSEYKTSWVLDTYESEEDPKIETDKDKILKKIKNFEEQYIKNLSIKNLKLAIQEYESICCDISNMYSYFSLRFKLEQKNPKISSALQKIQEWYTSCNAILCKFIIAIQKLSYDDITNEIQRDKEIAHYKAFIEDVFRYRDHTLSESEETVMAKLGAITGGAWYKFHEGILSRIEFPFEGKILTLSDIVEKANNGETEEIRKKASIALSEGLRKNEYALVSIYNNIVLSHKVYDDIRKYTTPEASRYLADNIPQEAVETMIQAVTDHYAKICHRYYKIKAKILGKKKLQYWDRCSEVRLTRIDDKKYTYDESLEVVFSVYKNFSENFYKIIKNLVDSSRVDAFPKDGKVSGAFAHSMPNDKPYVMLNFYGSARDIMTIAHEFGHAIHMTLSLKNKYLVSDPPLNISETASTFGEKLANEYLLSAEKDPKKKIELMCSRLDDVMSTIFRQVAFFKFEQKIHNMRKDKELTADELGTAWRNVLTESLGDGVELHSCVNNIWGYVTHFTGCPFYVYSYAFGALFVEGLYSEYKKKGKDFVKVYEEALASGGTKTYSEIANMFGIDANSRKFWDSALEMIEEEIDELEKLCENTRLV